MSRPPDAEAIWEPPEALDTPIQKQYYQQAKRAVYFTERVTNRHSKRGDDVRQTTVNSWIAKHRTDREIFNKIDKKYYEMKHRRLIENAQHLPWGSSFTDKDYQTYLSCQYGDMIPDAYFFLSPHGKKELLFYFAWLRNEHCSRYFARKGINCPTAFVNSSEPYSLDCVQANSSVDPGNSTNNWISYVSATLHPDKMEEGEKEVGVVGDFGTFNDDLGHALSMTPETSVSWVYKGESPAAHFFELHFYRCGIVGSQATLTGHLPFQVLRSTAPNQSSSRRPGHQRTWSALLRGQGTPEGSIAKVLKNGDAGWRRYNSMRKALGCDA